MNKRQALKAAAAHIVELENYNVRAKADIIAYNKCVDGMIAGESPCKWCEDHARGECDKPEHNGKGCSEWMLMWEHGEKGDDDDSKGILETGKDSGEGAINLTGADAAL